MRGAPCPRVQSRRRCARPLALAQGSSGTPALAPAQVPSAAVVFSSIERCHRRREDLQCRLDPAVPEKARADVISARGLTKVYGSGPTAVHALRGVDLDIAEGEFVVLLGPSGSGKSTLLNILGGLDVPSAGRWSFRGQAMEQANDAALTAYRRAHVGFVFQFYNLIASLTVLENVALVTELVEHPMSAREAVALVGLAERTEHFPAQLSGGEQQRVAVARAIAKRPELLLCDEPTGALDYATGKTVLQVLARVSQELSTTVVIITHNAAIAAMADRVIRFGDGQIQRIERNARRAQPAELSW